MNAYIEEAEDAGDERLKDHYQGVLQSNMNIAKALEEELDIAGGIERIIQSNEYVDGRRRTTRLEYARDLITAGVDSTSSVAPGSSDYRDLRETLEGKDIVTEEKLTIPERVFTGGLMLLPFVGAAAYRKLLKNSIPDESLNKIDDAHVGTENPGSTSTRSASKGYDDVDYDRLVDDLNKSGIDGDATRQQQAIDLFDELSEETGIDWKDYVDEIKYDSKLGKRSYGHFTVDPNTGERRVVLGPETFKDGKGGQRLTAMHELLHAMDFDDTLKVNGNDFQKAHELFFVGRDTLQYKLREIMTENASRRIMMRVYRLTDGEIEASEEYANIYLKQIKDGKFE